MDKLHLKLKAFNVDLLALYMNKIHLKISQHFQFRTLTQRGQQGPINLAPLVSLAWIM